MIDSIIKNFPALCFIVGSVLFALGNIVIWIRNP